MTKGMCESCGKIFEKYIRSPNQRFCSTRCQNRENMKRFRENNQEKLVQYFRKYRTPKVIERQNMLRRKRYQENPIPFIKSMSKNYYKNKDEILLKKRLKYILDKSKLS
jgi:hypothetical protein